MFQLDDTFLSDVGLASLPDDQKQPFLQHVYDELELRVGTRLSDGMSDAQLQEFESIIDRKMEIVDSWLTQNFPSYQADPAFARLQEVTKLSSEDPALRSEFAATKWLEKNRPNYRDVVAQVLDELKREIASSRDSILGSQAV
ncbi:MAG TPA: DUF5663 domain-containing protein [Candidatus Saccharimonadales bacterium]|nr:DUF5663 domain-containing protein [Candidatus Saccharimonadales bacterium]